MRLIAIVLAALLLGACSSKSTPPPAATSGPTLDCAKPANSAQQLVCDDPVLRDLDNRIAGGYQRALDRTGADKSALTAAQDKWAAQRDACAKNADVRTCVREAYQTRLVELAMSDPATAIPPVVTFRCPAEDSPLTAQFFNQFEPPAAVLEWKGAQHILFAQPSGSGSRYGRQGIEYWEHQGEVQVDFSGIPGCSKFVCKTPS
ncbi:MliC family protein [Mycobacterium bourgelatii]|uniref:Lipoprotein LprI n=1 Tax=Mycobacterium bourgelatii TaxID=1273442 RepID=A0A7I9YNV9_MYCBU|nr:MliC family protein [Mycobacterium bourgelatii]MCV6976008.1 MliC family protein [Mycobacterium bourgelatii]GFG90262.1 lipoprotein LprI [Mycobacterium bourgelatii]